VVVIYVLVERDPLFLQWVTGQPADETGVVDVCIKRFIVFVQLPEGVNYNSEDNVKHHNHHNYDLKDVIE